MTGDKNRYRCPQCQRRDGVQIRGDWYVPMNDDGTEDMDSIGVRSMSYESHTECTECGHVGVRLEFLLKDVGEDVDHESHDACR